MASVFLDESGDLGFNFLKKKTSRYFVVTALFVANEKPVRKIVKKIFQSLSLKERKTHFNSLHAFRDKPKTRQKLLTLVSKQEVSIISIYLDKKKVYTRLRNENHLLYNYVANILLDRICTKKLIPLSSGVTLIASQRETNAVLNDNFKGYLERQLVTNHAVRLHTKIVPFPKEKCLQIVDFCCWAIFRKYEYGDESYYNLLKRRIVEENPLFR